MHVQSSMNIATLAFVLLCMVLAVVSADRVPQIGNRTFSVGAGCMSYHEEIVEGKSVMTPDYESVESVSWLEVVLDTVTGPTIKDHVDNVSLFVAATSCKSKPECQGHIDINFTSAIHDLNGFFTFFANNSYSGTFGNEKGGPYRQKTMSKGGRERYLFNSAFTKSFNATPLADPSLNNEIFWTLRTNGGPKQYAETVIPKGGCPAQMVNGAQVILFQVTNSFTMSGPTPTPTPSTPTPSTETPGSASTARRSLFLAFLLCTILILTF
eukprot:Nk52_evm10s1636 gene=Nk52_evmTU10s1636